MEDGIKFIVGVSAALVGAGIYKLIKKGNEPIEATYKCISVSWRHETEILRKETITEYGWEVPKNAVVLDSRQAYKDMKKVPDGVDDNGEIKYNEEPEYATWYSYRTEKYVCDHVKSASGSCNFFGDTMTCPHDPEIHLDDDDVKIGKTTRSYLGTFRNVDTGQMKTFNLTREVWDTIRPDVKVRITTTKWNPNTIKSINII